MIKIAHGSDEAVMLAIVVKNNLERNFVKRVLKEALGEDISDLKLLGFAVHVI